MRELKKLKKDDLVTKVLDVENTKSLDGASNAEVQYANRDIMMKEPIIKSEIVNSEHNESVDLDYDKDSMSSSKMFKEDELDEFKPKL
mmetsp:Transcript_7068/g.9565  ORF Transcript_7068/g.9565 Transcript_7068/m.9565 type:complete len:88 (+) Transcript_7068:442-705(+)